MTRGRSDMGWMETRSHPPHPRTQSRKDQLEAVQRGRLNMTRGSSEMGWMGTRSHPPHPRIQSRKDQLEAVPLA